MYVISDGKMRQYTVVQIKNVWFSLLDDSDTFENVPIRVIYVGDLWKCVSKINFLELIILLYIDFDFQSFPVTEDSLKTYFEQAGPVEKVKLGGTKKQVLFAFVTFENAVDCSK